MNNLNTVKVCPLGKQCREIKDNTVYECVWLTKVEGVNPQNGERIDKEDCTINNMTLFLADMSRSNNQVIANTNDARDKTVEAVASLALAIATRGAPNGTTTTSRIVDTAINIGETRGVGRLFKKLIGK